MCSFFIWRTREMTIIEIIGKKNITITFYTKIQKKNILDI